MRKPTDVLDRDREWSTLSRIWESNRPELGFAVGRRRVGKSYVLSRFARSVGGVYYQANKRIEKEQLAGIGQVLAQHFGDAGLKAGLEFPSWEATFDFITKRSRGGPLFLVIDEFPYLVEAAPALPSIIQKFWDHKWHDTRIKLVLSGSYVSAMSRLEAADQPLYGRRTTKVLFEPFTYREAGLFIPECAPQDRLIAYGAFGHLPGNLALMNPEKSLASNVASSILNPSGRLADDAQLLLDAFLGESAVYYGILEAVARGDHTWKGITNRVGRSGGSLSRPLQWLEEMGLIDRVTPITESNPAKSRRSQYRVADPYIRFWHQLIAPLASAGMLGMVDSERLWHDRIAPRLDDYMGMVFETACRDFVRYSNALPFSPIRVGEWWDASSSQQVDVVALGSNDELLVGECKWGRVSGQDLIRLRQRTVDVVSELGIQPSSTYLALFSGRGGADSKAEDDLERDDILYFGPSALCEPR